MTPETRSSEAIPDVNRHFYDALWMGARLVEPERFNTWPLVQSLVLHSQRRLEVAPGLRPRLPIEGTCFVDLSAPAVMRLRRRGANTVHGSTSSLPFPDGTFDLVCALDIVEHVDDEKAAFHELSRVASPGAVFLLSVPLHPSQWTAFDDFVGHYRRYEPGRLLLILAEHGFSVRKSAVFGMQPKSSRLLELAMWGLTHRRERAMWWYNRVLMPLALRFQKKLAIVPGVIETDGVDAILLVCGKEERATSSASKERTREVLPRPIRAGSDKSCTCPGNSF
jgi:SAM-dependent methyltransferase